MVALDVDLRQISHVNAGQSRPVLLRNGKLKILKGPGPRFPLGMVEGPEYESDFLQLQKGDRLLLCTDGVSEAMNGTGEMFGNRRLNDLFLSLGEKQLTSKQIVATIRDEVLAFSVPDQQHDDLTVVCLQVIE
jgi:sigma-B regulation protein RsbU (phosphoserine phosphatase)